MDRYSFSKREIEVAELLLQGKSNKQIALLLGISEHTVEFHLKNIYEKLGVSSRTEAILILGKTSGWKTGAQLDSSDSTVELHRRNTSDPLATGSRSEAITRLGKTPGANTGAGLGDSAVEGEREITENEGGSSLAGQGMSERRAMKAQTPAKFTGWLKILVPIGIVLAGVLVYLITRPSPWESYERECEYPDQATVGQLIYRSNASGAKVHGQFGTTADAPWPAKSGYVVYKGISIPQTGQLYLKLRYSKNTPSAAPILVYLDDEPEPRASIFLVDQQNWDQFTWTEPIPLSEVRSGVHTLKLSTVGQDYGVADLDKLVLTKDSP